MAELLHHRMEMYRRSLGSSRRHNRSGRGRYCERRSVRQRRPSFTSQKYHWKCSWAVNHHVTRNKPFFIEEILFTFVLLCFYGFCIQICIPKSIKLQTFITKKLWIFSSTSAIEFESSSFGSRRFVFSSLALRNNKRKFDSPINAELEHDGFVELSVVQQSALPKDNLNVKGEQSNRRSAKHYLSFLLWRAFCSKTGIQSVPRL